MLNMKSFSVIIIGLLLQGKHVVGIGLGGILMMKILLMPVEQRLILIMAYFVIMKVVLEQMIKNVHYMKTVAEIMEIVAVLAAQPLSASVPRG